ncbi:transcription factor Opi1-domain-containing protein [Acrodontium crateriforme]|uniref:Transcription factor Opi1-domain-containing protein n=1 Tax=Acrodontium crateriforme TaxID=150365 RepID=A0AAQ3R7U0_9PEZI|nr:transcription factor Opi1-domain-containing protein [Acrodontium crateriforme]
MERERERPPDYASHEPNDLRLPAVPQHDFSRPPGNDFKLPDLKTVLSGEFQSPPPHNILHRGSPESACTLSRIESTYGRTNGARNGADALMMSPSEASSRTSNDDRAMRSTSVVSMDDPDVRIAAEALSGLGNPDFGRPASKTAFHVPSHASSDGRLVASPTHMEEEPFLELLTQAHPWVGGTIHGSLSAYTTTKHYSPRLVQAGANLVERNITTPIVSTVSTVGRMTGVESGLRWYLGRKTNDLESNGTDAAGSQKRRQVDCDMDMDGGFSPRSGMRRDSQDSRSDVLPLYRASKPPSYREEESPASAERNRQLDAHNRSWSTQVFVMTSGLGVALSDTSRNSLCYCLGSLSRATEHITTVTDALAMVLEQYDEAREHWHQNHALSIEEGERPKTPDNDQAAQRLAALIKKHSDDIWHTLKTVVNHVSDTAGGALPENARHFVRNQLMSLPQRWRVVSDRQDGDSETSRNAHRMIEFAREGLDMIGQVSQVCRATLDSAEVWLQRAGRRRANGEISKHRHDEDEVMGDADDMHYSQYNEKQ